VKGGLRSLGRSAFASLDVCENVLLAHPPADARAGDLREIDAVLVGDAANHRRVEAGAIALVFIRGGGGGGGLGRLSFLCLLTVVLVGVRLAGPRLGVDLGEQRSDRDGGARLDQDAVESAGGRRRDLDVDLVRGDVADRLVDLDPVAGTLPPLDDRALGDGNPHLGHHDLDRVRRCLLSRRGGHGTPPSCRRAAAGRPAPAVG
jgi:hypothetical protein